MSEFDDTNQLTEGADPTAQAGSFASLLLQMVREATPGDLYGLCIRANDTPPTTGDDAWRKRCFWFNPSFVRTDGGLGGCFLYDETAGSWENLEDYLDSYGEVPDESITIGKLSVAGNTAAFQLIRVNAARTAFEFVTPGSDLFVDGTIAVSKLAAAAGENYILLSNSAGQWQTALFSAAFAAEMFDVQLFVSQFVVDVGGSPGDVLYRGANTNVLVGPVVDRIAANSLPTAKLAYPAGSALKMAQVNASGSNLQFITPQAVVDSAAIPIKVALLSVTATAGTDGQTVAADTTATVALNTEVSDSASLVDSGSLPDFTLIVGTFLIEAFVPVARVTLGQVQLYNVDTSTVVAHCSVASQGTEATPGQATLVAIVSVTGSGDDTFRLRFRNKVGSASAILGLAVDLDLGEVHTQVKITKIA